jgi:hypothetical protein
MGEAFLCFQGVPREIKYDSVHLIWETRTLQPRFLHHEVLEKVCTLRVPLSFVFSGLRRNLLCMVCHLVRRKFARRTSCVAPTDGTSYSVVKDPYFSDGPRKKLKLM